MNTQETQSTYVLEWHAPQESAIPDLPNKGRGDNTPLDWRSSVWDSSPESTKMEVEALASHGDPFANGLSCGRSLPTASQGGYRICHTSLRSFGAQCLFTRRDNNSGRSILMTPTNIFVLSCC